MKAEDKTEKKKAGFCPNCRTYNLWKYGDHAECHNCEQIYPCD